MKTKIILIVMFFVLASCSAIKNENLVSITKTFSLLVENYEDRAKVLKSIHEAVTAKCNAGQITPAMCDRLKEAYNDARTSFILQGDELIKKIKGENNRHEEATKEADLKYEKLRRLYLEVK